MKDNIVRITSMQGMVMYEMHHSTPEEAYEDYLDCIRIAKECPSWSAHKVYRYRWGRLMCMQIVYGEA